jgi:hypothetical protein
MNHRLLFAGVPLLALIGCASQPATYQAEPDHSRAYNLAQAAGLWKAQDFEIPRDQGAGLASAMFDLTTGTALFNNPHGLGLALGDAAGLSMLSFLFSPPAQLDRDTVLAWIPSTAAEDKEQAIAALSEALYEASLAVFEENGFAYAVEYKDNERHALFDPYYETRINFTSEGHECGIRYQFFPREVSDEAEIPSFIMPSQRGYRIWAAHEIRYPLLDIGCIEADPAKDLKIASQISERLPEGVFFYMSSRASADRTTKSPPMILDHGAPLLFLKPAA